MGFKTADRIAQALGLAHEHPSRVEAGIVFALNELINDGHVYAPQDLLAQKAVELLEVPPDLIAPALERLAQDERVRPELIPLINKGDDPESKKITETPGLYGTPVIYLTPLYFSEKGVAERLKALVGAIKLPDRFSQIPFPDQFLSEEQQSAVHMAIDYPVSILTGGPGTGKTTCLKALITVLEAQRKRYALASPTGRAAKRLSEATDARPAPSTACWSFPLWKGLNTTVRICSMWTFWLWTKPPCSICC